MSSHTVKIFGEEYNIRSKDDPEYVRQVAEYIDGKMKEVARATGLVSSTKVAILVALNITDEYFRLRQQSEAESETLNRLLGEIIKLIDAKLEERKI